MFVIKFKFGFYNGRIGPVPLRDAVRYNSKEEAQTVLNELIDGEIIEMPEDTISEQSLLKRLFAEDYDFLMQDILEYVYGEETSKKRSVRFFTNSFRIRTKLQSIEIEEIDKIREKFPSAQLKLIGNYDADIDIILNFEK